MRHQGIVNFHAGYLKTLSDAGDRIGIEYRKRGSPETIVLSIDWIVDCTGMERAGLAHSPLLQKCAGKALSLLIRSGSEFRSTGIRTR